MNEEKSKSEKAKQYEQEQNKQIRHQIDQLVVESNIKKQEQEQQRYIKLQSNITQNGLKQQQQNCLMKLIPKTIKFDKYEAELNSDNDDQNLSNNKSFDGSTKNISSKKQSIDISHFLPPANPLAPKIYSEEFNIYTAINIQFQQVVKLLVQQSLPEFNKYEKYFFSEPQSSLKPLDQIQEKLNCEKNRTLFEYHNTIKDKLVYQRHQNLNLLTNPTKMKDIIYFASVICKLNRLIRSDKKVYLQEHLQKGLNIKKMIQETVLKRKHEQSRKGKKIETSINEGQNTNQQTSQSIQLTEQQNQQQQLKQQYQNSDITNQISESTVDFNTSQTNTQIGNNIINTSILTNTITTISPDNEKSQCDNNSLITNRNNANSIINTISNNASNNNNQLQNINLIQNESIKDSLIFSSEFESGNLFTAYQVSENNYEIMLQNDINTKGNTQWFFFRVQNTKKDQTVTFTILNLIKTGSLFNNGLCPVIFSKKRSEETGQEWTREGFDIRYFKNNIFRDGFRTNKFYNSLTFSYTFQYNSDTVYFAHSFPYTYSDLQDDLTKIMNDKEKSQYISRKALCTTLAGNILDSLTITSTSAKKRGQRKGIIIFSRQHPGETGGSYMMKGIINFLLSNTPEAEFLRDACIFKIVPMVNPDGVIHGNYRCDLAGADLNRRWKKPNKQLHPTVYSIKEMVKKFHSERETKLILDLHGHSRKMDAFFYGCQYKEDPLKTRIFPYLLTKINSKINFRESRFSMDAYKESTARISLWRELKAPNVFTLEASFYGFKKNMDIQTNLNNEQDNNQQKTNREVAVTRINQDLIQETKNKEGKDNPQNVKSTLAENQKKNTHFTIQDYLDIGRDICINLFNIIHQETNIKENKEEFVIDQNSYLYAQLQEIAGNKELLENGNQSDSGSDSNPSEDGLDDEELLDIVPKNVLNKKQKQILNERMKKEKNEKVKKIKTQIVQEQPNLQQQIEIKRKQTNQMYLQRYLQKQQEKLANNKGKGSHTKKDQEQQTDASFLYDLYLYMEKKNSQKKGEQKEQEKKQIPTETKEINNNNNTNLQNQNINVITLNSNTQNQPQINASTINSPQNINSTQNIQSIQNNNSSNILNFISSPSNSIYSKATSNLQFPVIPQNQTPSIKKNESQDITPIQQRQSQNLTEENLNNSIIIPRNNSKPTLQKGFSQYNILQSRVKSLDQNKNQPFPPNAKFTHQNIFQSSNTHVNQDIETPRAENNRGQQSQRLLSKPQLINVIQPVSSVKDNPNLLNMSPNNLLTVNENNNIEERALTEQSPLIKPKYSEQLERRRETSMSFSYGTGGILKSNYGPLDHAFKLQDNKNNNNIESGRNNNQLSRINAAVIQSDGKSLNNYNLKQPTDLQTLRKADIKLMQKDGSEKIKIKQIYNQKRLEQQHFNSTDLSSLQGNGTKQSLFGIVEKNDTSNRSPFSLNNNGYQIQSQLASGIQDIINSQKHESGGINSFLPQLGSPKQNLNYNNTASIRYASEQPLSNMQTNQVSLTRQQTNSNLGNFGVNSYKNNQNSFNLNQQLAQKTNLISSQNKQEALSKTQSVQLLFRARQNIQNQQKIQ